MSRKVFVSYAREDRDPVRAIEERLRRLGFDVWLDQALRGGQAWWEEVLSQIRASHALVAVVSADSLQSEACARERDYAAALGKPVVPVVVERVRVPLPTDIVSRQVVDFTPDNPDRAFALASALIDLPSASSLPDPLPPAPEIPLSYLAHLVDLVEARHDLTRAEQFDILDDLEPGLRATDRAERDGAWHVLRALEVRPDLLADSARRIERLRSDYPAETSPSPVRRQDEGRTDPREAPLPTRSGPPNPGSKGPEQEPPTRVPEESDEPKDKPNGERRDEVRRRRRRVWWAIGAPAAVLGLFLTLVILRPWPQPPAESVLIAVEAGIPESGIGAGLDAVSATTGIDVEVATLSSEQLAERVRGHDPPDIAVLANSVDLLTELASEGSIRALDDVLNLGDIEDTMIRGTLDVVGGTNGEAYAIPLHIDVKSLVWYPGAVFEQAGYQSPESHQELVELTDRIKRDGLSPWCFGIASGEFGQYTGWPMTDWVEEYVLRIAGPDFYDRWVRHEIPFSHPVVKQAAQAAAELLLPEGNTFVGDGPAIAEEDWAEAAQPLVAEPPGCELHRQAPFILGQWPEQERSNVGLRTFLLPRYDGGWEGQAILGTGVWAALVPTGNEAAAASVLNAMTGPGFGEEWARTGHNFISPNKAVDTSVYPSELSRSIADLAASADVFRYDGSDMMPEGVGGAFGSFLTGMADWVSGTRELEIVLDEIEAGWPHGD